MAKMTGGQALIQSLYHEGITVIFGLPGVHQYHAVDAIYQEPRIQYISTRHEQATSFMADAYARVSGQIAASLIVPGPGLYNAGAGIATAHAVSSPLLVITGDHPIADKPSPDLRAVEPITKWTGQASTPQEIPHLVREAFWQMRHGRPGPTAIDIAPHILAEVADIALLEPATVQQPQADISVLQDAVSVLAQAKKPVIWAGAGVVWAKASMLVQQLAEHLQAPVITSRQGKGVISSHHPLCLQMGEIRYRPLKDWFEQCDVVLAIGTSRHFGKTGQTIIKIDIDKAAFASSDNVIPIESDARDALEHLLDALTAKLGVRDNKSADIVAQVAAINSDRFNPAKQLQPQWDLMQAIRAAMPDDGILVQGMNQMGYYSRNYFPAYTPGTYLTASNHATLGSAFPLALGAKVAKPDQAVIALSGDGGFLYNSQELATAVKYGINVVVIVFNDNAYGNVLRAQIEDFDEHVIGTQLHNPDFVKLAQAYGARGVKANDSFQLETAIRQAISTASPTVIEVPVGQMAREF